MCVGVCDAICREQMQLIACQCAQAVVDTPLVNPQVQTPCQVILLNLSFSLVFGELALFPRFHLCRCASAGPFRWHLWWSYASLLKLMSPQFWDRWQLSHGLWNPALPQKSCAGTCLNRRCSTGFQSPSLRGHAVSLLKVPKKLQAPVLEHFPDWYWGCFSWQLPCTNCTCLRIWYLAAFVGILHKDQTMSKLDKDANWFAVIRFRRRKVLVLKDENVRRSVWGMTALHVHADTSCASCSIWHFLRLYKSSGLGFVFQGIQINPKALDIQCRKRWSNMQPGSPAFTISVFWKMRVLASLTYTAGAISARGFTRMRRWRCSGWRWEMSATEEQVVHPLKRPLTFWVADVNQNPKIQRWSFGCEILNKTPKRPLQTKTSDWWCFLMFPDHILQYKTQNVFLKGIPSPVSILQAELASPLKSWGYRDVSVISWGCFADVSVLFPFCHGVSEMLWWFLGVVSVVNDVLVMVWSCSREVSVVWGAVSVMCGSCVGDALLMSRGYCGDDSVMCQWCLIDVLVLCGWCLSDVSVMFCLCSVDVSVTVRRVFAIGVVLVCGLIVSFLVFSCWF